MKKTTKKVMAVILIAALVFSFAACGGEKAPESISVDGAVILAKAGDTYTLSPQFAGEGADTTVNYASSDEAVVTVSAEGVITAVGNGTASVTVTSAVDENVAASAEVTVFDYTGKYSGTKHVDAMGCDITVEMELASDGQFTYYRAPMVISMAGGGEMPEMKGTGTYEFKDGAFVFTTDVTGEFSLALSISDGTATLAGSIPTGGAPTSMEISR